MIKKIKILLFSLLLFLPQVVFAQSYFKAEVVSIVEEKKVEDESGNVYNQQNIKLNVLDGNFKGREVFYYGIGDIQMASSHDYQVGDKVIVNYSQNSDGEDMFYITEYDRSTKLYYLAAIFALSIILVGRLKGFRSLLALAFSFFIILKFIIPKILAGFNPVLISVSGGIFILLAAIYLTQGINRKAHLASLSLFFSLLITAALSVFFTKITRLTGFTSEETLYLLELENVQLNFQGLLLAGILIGVLGVLDDTIISQISTVEQIKKANPGLAKSKVYFMSLKVGVDHITSMTNTLFFAYAGVSLPLLILFSAGGTPFMTFSQAINQEIIATEIVRTLVGSIGLILSIPIANYLATYFLKVKQD